MKKEEYEKELNASMLDLRKAWIRCSLIFGNIYYDCNDYIVDDYPFDKSFDDMDVINWIDKVIENIEQSQNKEKTTFYTISKTKTIPIPKEAMTSISKEKILFDDEIVINVDNIYENNRVRLIIYETENDAEILVASYQKNVGLCYHSILMMKDEYSHFSDINKCIRDILIEGKYMERGDGISTDIANKSNYLKENDDYNIDI